MQTSDQIGTIVAAIAKAQLEVRNPTLDKAHPHFKGFRYASLGAHLDAIREPFARNGLIVTQGVTSSENQVGVTTMIAHSSGEWMRSTVAMSLPERATAQNLGAIVTYLRRYAIASIAMLTGDDDTDADEDREARQPQRPAPAPKPAEREAIFSTQPINAAPRKEQPMAWDPDGTEIVTMRKVVERPQGAVAVLCEHPRCGNAWVQFGAELAASAVAEKRIELTWEFNERGGYMRAVEVRAAPRLQDALGGGK